MLHVKLLKQSKLKAIHTKKETLVLWTQIHNIWNPFSSDPSAGAVDERYFVNAFEECPVVRVSIRYTRVLRAPTPCTWPMSLAQWMNNTTIQKVEGCVGGILQFQNAPRLQESWVNPHCHVSLSKLNIKFAKTWSLFSNNVNTTISHQELSFEWSHLKVSLDGSGFRSFLGLVKFALLVKELKYCTSIQSSCGYLFKSIILIVYQWRSLLYSLFACIVHEVLLKYSLLTIHLGLDVLAWGLLPIIGRGRGRDVIYIICMHWG